jgi:hypothetical protein
MTEHSIPPGAMFRSFLTVASGYVLTQILFIGIAYLLGLLFFPEFIAFFNLDKAAQQAMMEDNPHDAIPQAMFWMMVAGNFLACLGVGWLVAKTAPFAKFPHAVFLAVLMFIMFMQIVIADPPAKKRMDIIYMGALPIAILLGAKRAVDRSFKSEPQAESE